MDVLGMKLNKWARQNGSLWHEYTCAEAERNGHFAVLKWARENGCPEKSKVRTGKARRNKK